MKNKLLLAVLPALILTACTSKKAEPFVDLCPDTILFQTEVKPIIDSKCVTCHVSGGSGTGDFTDFAVLKSKVDDGTMNLHLFVAKDMPPGGNPQLSEEELRKIKCWMEQGAPNN